VTTRKRAGWARPRVSARRRAAPACAGPAGPAARLGEALGPGLEGAAGGAAGEVVGVAGKAQASAR
jgi:hypothetical protein